MWKWFEFFFIRLHSSSKKTDWTGMNVKIRNFYIISALPFLRCVVKTVVQCSIISFSTKIREMNKRWNAFCFFIFPFFLVPRFPYTMHNYDDMNCSFNQTFVENRLILRYVKDKACYDEMWEHEREGERERFSTMATNWDIHKQRYYKIIMNETLLWLKSSKTEERKK